MSPTDFFERHGGPIRGRDGVKFQLAHPGKKLRLALHIVDIKPIKICVYLRMHRIALFVLNNM